METASIENHCGLTIKEATVTLLKEQLYLFP